MRRRNKVDTLHDVVIEIREIGSKGEGIGIYKGEPVYIPLTACGDTVIADLEREGKSAWRGALKAIQIESIERQKPVCEHFGECGGCSIQHLSHKAYLDWIDKRLRSTFAHHGIFDLNILPPVLSPQHSRRRLQLEAVQAGGRILLGLHGRKQHKIINLHMCPVSAKALVDLFDPLRKLLQGLLLSGQRSRIHLNLTDAGVSILIELPQDPDLAAREKLAMFSVDNDLAELSISIRSFVELVARHREPTLSFDQFKVSLPVDGFMQATAEGQSTLQDIAVRAVEKGENVADLFCGLGTFSLPLLTKAKVHAVDGDLKLLKALEMGANAVPGRQLTIEHRDLFRRPLLADELNEFSTVIIDPPRAGAREQFFELAKSSVRKIVGISCNPNTFARDAKILVDAGFTIGELTPVDQFLWSHNLELAAVFRRA